MALPKGTPWTTGKVDNLFANLRRLTKCMEKISVALGGTDSSTTNPTTSQVIIGTIDDTESFGGVVEGQMRNLEFQADSAGIFEIEISLSDGSNLTFRTFGNGVWSYQSANDRGTITQVTATNITGSAGAVNCIFNLSS